MSECHRDGEGDHGPGMPLRATETALRATQGPNRYPKSPGCSYGPEIRCEQSDLPASQCAHCRGDQPIDVEPEPRRYDPAPRGRRVWPPAERATPRPAIPAPPEEPTDDPKVLVARDLRAIGHMAALLGDRALDLADDQHLPGGEAMVNLAPTANLEAWQHQVETDERLALAQAHGLTKVRHAPYTSVADEDPDEAWPAYQTLRYWSEDWRRERGIPDIEVPTIATETRFLADSIGWAWAGEPHFDEFADDVKAARTKLENVVRDGIRETRSRVVCDRCANPKRLIRKYGKAGKPDTWKAPCCKAKLTADEAKRILARQLKSEGAERWVTVAEAIGALRAQGWDERTVRGWLEPIHRARDRCTECGTTWPPREFPACPAELGLRGTCGGMLVPVWAGDRDAVVAAWCDPEKHQTWCWWPDLWWHHLLAKQERADAAQRRAERAARRTACEAAHGEDCWERGRCTDGRKRRKRERMRA